MKQVAIILGFLVCVLYACRDRYEPMVISSNNSYLVVEGNIQAGDGETTVRLTRTFKLDDSAQLKTEDQATMRIEDENNGQYPLTWVGDGYYKSGNLNLPVNQSYRLRIMTGGQEYVSDYVLAKETPPIDSVNWTQEGETIRIFVNAHDPSGNTRYYRWNYEETWEIRSYYFALYIYENGAIRPRDLATENVATCWKYHNSNSIFLANSTRQNEDIIHEMPLLLIPPRDEKLQVRYSVLVKQYALDKESYNFYDLMKKTSEDIGSLFSAQPFELRGNIRNVNDAADYVIGQITASTVTEKRIFIEIPGWRFTQDCPSYELPNNKDSIEYYFGPTGFLDVFDYTGPPPASNKYRGAFPQCVDCQVRGGNTNRPSYW